MFADKRYRYYRSVLPDRGNPPIRKGWITINIATMNTPTQPQRLISLDALRRFTIAIMIVVNYPGREDSVFFTLRHTICNGLSFTDQVAPFFLFLLGAPIPSASSDR